MAWRAPYREEEGNKVLQVLEECQRDGEGAVENGPGPLLAENAELAVLEQSRNEAVPCDLAVTERMHTHFVSNRDTVHRDNKTELEKVDTDLSEGLDVRRRERTHLFGQEHVGILFGLRLHIERAEAVRNQLRAIGNPRRDDNEDEDGRNVSSL